MSERKRSKRGHHKVKRILTLNFEVVEVLGAHRTLLHFPDLAFPGFFDVRDCCHVTLYAKPEHPDNAPKYFFIFEMLDLGSGKFDGLESQGRLITGLTGSCKFCPSEKEYPHSEGCKRTRVFGKILR